MLIHELFFNTAAQTPDAPAIEFSGTVTTYYEAAIRVRVLAQTLADTLPAHSRVAVHMRKSDKAVLTLLACLTAGMTYVPIDPRYPPLRLREVVMAASVTALLVDDVSLLSWDEDWLRATGVAVIDVTMTMTDCACKHQSLMMRPEDSAYILFTSGSTGVPKGVIITHANAAAFVGWACRAFDVRPDDRVAVHAQLNFDLPVFDLYVTLAKGGTVVMIDEETTMYPQALFNFLREHRITVLYAVPSALNSLVAKSTLCRDGLPDLRLLLYAGEEYLPGPLRRLVEAIPSARVFNLYGPIETNVVTYLEVRPEHLDMPRVPLGNPVDNVKLVLVDADGCIVQRAGQSVISPTDGEIIVIGECVSPGYLNKPEATEASRLIVNGAMGYRTGDYGSWDDDGTLRFLGRRDSLVKIRGFRVELGDVEAVLVRHPSVVEAVVVACSDLDLMKTLTAFVHAKDKLSAKAVRVWVSHQLPDYMRPAQYVILDTFPRTGTGKIDRRALEVLDGEKS
ncbi:MAG: amino acid adenylation domain-containing protein [Propionibacteriaceae bacterium]|jgi:amino acid adenylation domain-containing protein|nr:amino acid adenylation domain-containing protein [Propionibacteriaceae bacterium]